MEEMEKNTPTEQSSIEEPNLAAKTSTVKGVEPQKQPRKPELDTETSFADMNVEGFRWYNPRKKKGKTDKVQLSRKEYWAMVRGAFSAMLPLIGCMLVAGALIVALAILWLN